MHDDQHGTAVVSTAVTPLLLAARQTSADVFSFIEERLSGTEDLRANGGVGYVLHRLAVAGHAGPALVARGALDQLHRASRGVPRVASSLLRQALREAHQRERLLRRHRVVREHVVDHLLARPLLGVRAGVDDEPRRMGGQLVEGAPHDQRGHRFAAQQGG